MVPITTLGQLVNCDALAAYTDPETWCSRRDEIKACLLYTSR